MKKVCLLVIGVVFVCSPLFAVTHYVDLNSTNPVPPYTNWATAATNIQDAVDIVSNLDTILVSDGIYFIYDNISSTQSYDLTSVNGPSATTIDGEERNLNIYVRNGGSISGFTVKNCRYINGDANINSVVSNCVVKGNSESGIYNVRAYDSQIIENRGARGGGASFSILYNCLVSGNLATSEGGGAYHSTLYNCTVSDNVSFAYGGGLSGGRAENCTITGNVSLGSGSSGGGGALNADLYSCLVINNYAYTGAGISQGKAHNCTFIDNIAEYGGDTCNESATIYNSIIYYYLRTPLDPDLVFKTSLASIERVYFSCSSYLVDGAFDNITDDPQFVDVAGGNYRLSESSPCINQGRNILSETEIDRDGNPRIVNGTVDMGAYEFQTEESAVNIPVRAVLEYSSDMQSWTNSGESAEWLVPANGGSGFYRTKMDI